MQEKLSKLLKSVYGYNEFRGSQEEIILDVVAGHDALVLMPTGGGKSLCYQLPALVRDGVGIVISPLIALMQDQVESLLELGVRAAFLNSSLRAADAYRVIDQLRKGSLDLLYLAPERLLKPDFLELLSTVQVALFAIDEAHCVSMWGHDFRVEYQQLGILHERFPTVPRIALTATADAPTRNDIKRQLGLTEAREFVSSFDRPNICYTVVPKQQVRAQLLELLRGQHAGDAGIVYCLSRKKVEEVATWLSEEGFPAIPYHAGLPDQQRAANQRRFLTEEGVVMVATIAFGMGINKPNVRFVAHLDLPKNLEAYYQETGRAGRDGLPATAWMAYGLSEVVVQRQLIEQGESNQDRKRVEHQKLSALLGFVETTRCRRQVLLNYFGEQQPERCGNCDTCLQPVATWDGTEAAQQALSCVYRTGQRFGVAYLTEILLGKISPRVQKFRHDALSVFGIGKERAEREWSSVFRQLVAGGFLTVDFEGYGALQLTAEAKPVLRGERSVSFRQDPFRQKISKKKERKATGPTVPHFVADETKALFDRLRAKRLELAKTHGVPPYVIFHDRTLIEIAEKRPLDAYALREIAGVGQSKLERYGELFLEVVREENAGPGGYQSTSDVAISANKTASLK